MRRSGCNDCVVYRRKHRFCSYEYFDIEELGTAFELLMESFLNPGKGTSVKLTELFQEVVILIKTPHQQNMGNLGQEAGGKTIANSLLSPHPYVLKSVTTAITTK
ncbi:MAG: hypothetical protein V7K47_11025 [Nostoc sp.]